MKKYDKSSFAIFGFLILVSALSFYAVAVDYPYGVRNLDVGESQRPNLSTYAPQSTVAEAGNITELSLTGLSTTKTWQGYFGNITGTITLEDASGYIFYNWTALEPKGEIYASTNSSITWSQVVCFNWTGQYITLEGEEDRYGIADDTADGLNETYTSNGLDKNFFVGTRNITQVSADEGFECHTTNTYRYGLGQSADNFENVLLTDNSSLIFTTVIENNDVDSVTDITGFNNRLNDFQLLVAENGRDGFEDSTTTYYFWAELE